MKLELGHCSSKYIPAGTTTNVKINQLFIRASQRSEVTNVHFTNNTLKVLR